MDYTTPVLLIFFNRPDTLEQVFEQIKKVKPKKLYLAQDGARNNNFDDYKNIIKCRDIVENITWDCQVFKKYEEKNLGCGRGPEKAINWFFENEEEGIILEDDCIASLSFFDYCSELLDKYRNDERIFMISGCNLELKTINVYSSYFFGYAGTNWGWATWKRNWKMMDYSCSWVNDDNAFYNVRHLISSINKNAARSESKLFKKTNVLVQKNDNINYWDVQFQSIRYLNHQLSIIPQINLITNIGLGPTSTHAKTSHVPSKLCSRVGKVNACYNERFELNAPLVHPDFVVENIDYDNKIYKHSYSCFFKSMIKKMISLIRKFIIKYNK